MSATLDDNLESVGTDLLPLRGHAAHGGCWHATAAANAAAAGVRGSGNPCRLIWQHMQVTCATRGSDS
jgi:hypothetical protein